jgi:hypothetical protein
VSNRAFVGKIIMKRNKKNNSKNKRIETPGDSQIYRGPVTLPGSSIQEDLHTDELSLLVPVTASGGGVINNVQAFSLSSFPQASSYQALYDEYRLLAMECTWIPQQADCPQVPANALAVIAMVLDRDSSAALTTLTQAASYASVKLKCVNKSMRVVYKMNGSEDAAWATTASAISAWIKVYGGALTASTLYGYIFLRGLFQFRGRVA